MPTYDDDAESPLARDLPFAFALALAFAFALDPHLPPAIYVDTLATPVLDGARLVDARSQLNCLPALHSLKLD